MPTNRGIQDDYCHDFHNQARDITEVAIDLADLHRRRIDLDREFDYLDQQPDTRDKELTWRAMTAHWNEVIAQIQGRVRFVNSCQDGNEQFASLLPSQEQRNLAPIRLQIRRLQLRYPHYFQWFE